ncbi:MAG: hypothetical protein NTZ83_04330 [Candidatus Pacearchaeota archaeon]|nr:hypothetical protein [Candidatus Pacearchaeota archaeon]
MQKKVTYTAEGRNPRENHIANINENVEKLLKRLGAKVVNSVYMLSEGLPTEAYGYYIFDGIGIITTILNLKNSEYNLSVNFFGFEGHTERYYKLKMYIEDTLNKVLY